MEITQSNLPMYTGIHHDRNNNILFIWYADGTRKAFKSNHRFFVPYPGGKYGAVDSGMKNIYGKPMYMVNCDSETEQNAKELNNGPNNELCESDIEYKTRWLQNYYKDVKDLRFKSNDFNICYIDIEVEVGDRFPTAAKADRRVNCVTIYLSKVNKYVTFGLQKYLKQETLDKLIEINGEYRRFETEKDLITDLFKTIGESEIDILSGWNVDWYDNPYLINRAKQLGIDIRLLSRLPFKFRSAYISKRDGTLKIGGTEVIDYYPLFKKFSKGERDNYKLDTIGMEVVGKRKAPLPDGYKSYINHWDDFVYYNVTDVVLLKEIDEKKRLMETVIGACSEARVPFGHIFEAKKILVGFLLNFLHARGIVMPPLKEHDPKEFPGGCVYATPGYYKCLTSYDYRSMYPSLMMGANISPETKIEYDINAIIPDEILNKLVRSPWTANGTKQVFYTKEKEGIVPAVVKILFDGRTELKKLMKKAEREGRIDDAAYFDMKQNAYKIFGNSLYGLLGNRHFQLYDLDNAASVTEYGYRLITFTTTNLSNYMENLLENDQRYFDTFKEKPMMDKKYNTKLPFFRGKTTEQFTVTSRFSHGDTDSFFVKYDDLYSVYADKKDKHVSVIVIDGNKVISEEIFDIATEERESKIAFNNACGKYISSWKTVKPEDKKAIFEDGLHKEGNFRIIYNRYYLTDYCRVLDAIIMEDLLADIMQKFSDMWSFRENTLYLKREKCILKAIVTAKKKYICLVESNEDKKNKKPKFSTTGLEIVRSSTIPFARERILTLVTELLDSMNKEYIRDRYLDMKKEFFELAKKGDVYSISIPSGVKSDPPQFNDWIAMPIEEKKAVDWRMRAGAVWNHLIETDSELSKKTYEPIYEGSKVKFIKVLPNQYGIKGAAYTGDHCPQRLLEMFKPDWEEQWEKTFAQTMARLFDAIGWGKNLESDRTELMMELF